MGLLSRLTELRRLIMPPAVTRLAQQTQPWLAGEPAASRVHVDEYSALGIPTVLACVRRLAGDVAKCPLSVVQEVGPNQYAPFTDHPLNALLNLAANSEMDSFIFREAMLVQLLLWGNSYCEVERSNGGRVLAMHLLQAARMEVYRVGGTGQLQYRYRDEDGRRTDLTPDQILHIRNVGDGIMGYSVVRLCRETLGIPIAAERFQGGFLGNAQRPSAVVKFPPGMKPEAKQNVKSSIDEKYSGARNAGRVFYLEDGVDFQGITMPMEDAQFIEQMKFSREQICAMFAVPPHKVGILDRATFSNIEHQEISYTRDSLGLIFPRVESAMTTQLLSPREIRQGLRCIHDESELLRGDFETRSKADRNYLETGVLSVDEVRLREGLPPVGGTAGSQRLRPGNTVDRDEQPDDPADDSAPSPSTDPAPPTRSPEDRAAMLVSIHAGEVLARLARLWSDKLNRRDDAESARDAAARLGAELSLRIERDLSLVVHAATQALHELKHESRGSETKLDGPEISRRLRAWLVKSWSDGEDPLTTITAEARESRFLVQLAAALAGTPANPSKE